MRNFIIPLIIFLSLAILCPAQARDFTVDDFDPPGPYGPLDPEDPDGMDIIDVYSMALDDLLWELTIYGYDSEANELFQVVPFPMELVALMTQAEIHFGNITDPSELAGLVDTANENKPAANSFAMILDGNVGWVGSDVTMFYFPNAEESDGIEVPCYRISLSNPDPDGNAISEWAVVVDSVDELTNLLAAESVALIVGLHDPEIEPLVLYCGFWRSWGLFDLRDDEESEVPEFSAE
jgi:hypothetical protein